MESASSRKLFLSGCTCSGGLGGYSNCGITPEKGKESWAKSADAMLFLWMNLIWSKEICCPNRCRHPPRRHPPPRICWRSRNLQCVTARVARRPPKGQGAPDLLISKKKALAFRRGPFFIGRSALWFTLARFFRRLGLHPSHDTENRKSGYYHKLEFHCSAPFQ